MKAIGVLLDGLHDVVETLAEPVGLAVLEEVQDAEAPSVEHLHVLQQLGDLALAHSALPVPQLGPRPLGVLPAEDDAQVFLEVQTPGGRQFALHAAPDVVDGHTQRLDDMEVVDRTRHVCLRHRQDVVVYGVLRR
jgi:hypothetical protein